jgi:hypothetical protein
MVEFGIMEQHRTWGDPSEIANTPRVGSPSGLETAPLQRADRGRCAVCTDSLQFLAFGHRHLLHLRIISDNPRYRATVVGRIRWLTAASCGGNS